MMLNAQSPLSFKYQAVIRDTSAVLIANQSVSLRISIHEVNPGGEIAFQETHDVITNQFGMVNLMIGQGTAVFGSLSAINWGNSSKFLEIELDTAGGTNYEYMGTTQLVSVPYALYAKRAEYSNDNDWVVSANNMYSNVSGNIGIGTMFPTHRLHLTGSESSPLLYVHKTGSGRGVRVYTTSACAIWVENAGNHGLRITHANGNGVNVTNANGSGIYVSNANSNGVHVNQASGWAGFFNGTGYFADDVGIGTISPGAKLDVNGNVIADYPSDPDHVATKQYVDDQLTYYENKISMLQKKIEELSEVNQIMKDYIAGLEQ
jgi:hypothetical protein